MGISQTPQALVPAEFTSGGITLLSTTSLSGTSTTISSINGSYTNLIIRYEDCHTTNIGNGLLRTQINGTPLNVRQTGQYDTTNQSNSANYLYLGGGTVTDMGYLAGNGIYGYVLIYNYASSTLKKPYSSSSFGVNRNISGGVINSTTAISSIIIDNADGATMGGSILIYGVN